MSLLRLCSAKLPPRVEVEQDGSMRPPVEQGRRLRRRISTYAAVVAEPVFEFGWRCSRLMIVRLWLAEFALGSGASGSSKRSVNTADSQSVGFAFRVRVPPQLKSEPRPRSQPMGGSVSAVSLHPQGRTKRQAALAQMSFWRICSSRVAGRTVVAV